MRGRLCIWVFLCSAFPFALLFEALNALNTSNDFCSNKTSPCKRTLMDTSVCDRGRRSMYRDNDHPDASRATMSSSKNSQAEVAASLSQFTCQER